MSESSYLDLLSHVLMEGEKTEDRTGTGTLSVFAPDPLRFDLREGFPLLTTKRVFMRGVIAELLWFLSGDTDNTTLTEQGINIWSADAERWGSSDLGPIYGAQWRSFGGVDQIENLIVNLKSNPQSRRHVVTAWNPAELEQMALPPCHITFQVNVSPCGTYSDLHMYQRSCDFFLGTPFNIASYALLLTMIAQQTRTTARHLIISMGDCHLYLNHQEQARTQLEREPSTFPQLVLTEQQDIFSYTGEDISVVGYEPAAAIKGDIST